MAIVIQDQPAAVLGPKAKQVGFLDRLFPNAQGAQSPIDSAYGLYGWGAEQTAALEPVATTGPLRRPSVPAYTSGTGVRPSSPNAGFVDASGPMPHPNAPAPVSLGPLSQAPAVPNAPLQAVSLGQPRPVSTPPAAPRSTDPNSVFLGPRSTTRPLKTSAPSEAAPAWSLAFPASGAPQADSAADPSQVMPNAIDYSTQYARQLADLIPSTPATQPAISPEAAQIPETAIERAGSAGYERAVGKMAEGIQAKRGSAGSILDKYRAHLLASAYMVGYSDPELAQSMRDIAGGLSTRGIKTLRDYVDSKISDAPTSKQFKREFDEAAAEAQKGSHTGQPAMRKLLDHLVKFAQAKTGVRI